MQPQASPQTPELRGDKGASSDVADANASSDVGDSGVSFTSASTASFSRARGAYFEDICNQDKEEQASARAIDAIR